MSADEPRFVLYEEDGTFGVFDRVGPQVFFAESRGRAELEVARANEIVAAYPDTVSMRHLRDMDAGWRAAHGVPVPAAPTGRTVSVPDPRPRAVAVRPAAQEDGRIAELLDTVAKAAHRTELRERAAAALREARGISDVARGLQRAWREAHAPLARLRAGLRESVGPGAGRDVEARLRASLAEVRGEEDDLPRRAAELLRRETPGDAASGAQRGRWSALAADAAHVARLDRALESAAARAGSAGIMPLRGGARAVRQVLAQLRERRAEVRLEFAAAREEFSSAAASLPSPRQLRRLWQSTPASTRDAVLQVAPEVPALLRRAGAGPGRAHRRPGPGLA